MQILTPTHSDQVPSALNDPAGNLLRPAQLAEHMQDMAVAKAQMENPNVQDKGNVRQRLRSLTKQYEAQAPRPITNGAVKDALATESKRLLDKILPGMLSQEEMRKNPAGSTDRHMRWERTNKKDIVRLKKILTQLNADSSDPHTWDRDAANLERFRPVGASDRLRTDAQIPGHMTFGNIPDAQWAQTFGSTHPENSALEQAKRVEKEREADTLDAIIAQAQTPIDSGIDLDMSITPTSTRPTKPARVPMSAEKRKEMGDRLARGKAEKKLRLEAKGA